MRLMRRVATGLGAAALSAGVLAVGVIPASAATAAAPAGTAQVTVMHHMELQAGLRGSHAYPRASGTASYEADQHSRALEVSLTHLAGLAGRHLVVYVHGAKAGTMTVSRAGYAHLDMHRGVPGCQAGQPIRIRTAGGTLVASGTFRVHHDY